LWLQYNFRLFEISLRIVLEMLIQNALSDFGALSGCNLLPSFRENEAFLFVL